MLIVFMTQSITIVGKEIESLKCKGSLSENEKWAEKPRALKEVKTPRGVGLALVELFGSPAKVKVPKDALWYYSEDVTLMQDYVRATTGLELASTLPGRN
jgi:hypothetical protein